MWNLVKNYTVELVYKTEKNTDIIKQSYSYKTRKQGKGVN